MSTKSMFNWFSPKTTRVVERLNTGAWRLETPSVDMEKCVLCSICVKQCPQNIISMTKVDLDIDYFFCKGCGICADVCPKDAIDMINSQEVE